MNDTNPKVLFRFRQMLMAKKPQERLLMGCSMFDAAKKIVRSAILEQQPDISPKRMKAEIFLRFYGEEFSGTEKEKILNRLR